MRLVSELMKSRERTSIDSLVDLNFDSRVYRHGSLSIKRNVLARSRKTIITIRFLIVKRICGEAVFVLLLLFFFVLESFDGDEVFPVDE